MSTALAVRTAPPVDPRDAALTVHRDAWAGTSAKVRAAAACQASDADTLVSLVFAYLWERNPDTSPHTCRSYAAGVRRFVSWARATGHPILRPGRHAGTAYRADLMATLGPGSANVRLGAARALYHALDWAGLDHADPFRHVAGVRDPRAEGAQRDEYSPAVVALMLRAARDPLDRLIVTLAAGCGLRCSEMTGLTWADVDLAAGTARVLGKGRKPARVHLTVEARDALADLPHREGPVMLAGTPDRDGRPRPVSGATVRYRTARMAAAAGVVPSHRGPRTTDGERVDLGPHRLRHSFGTTLARRYGVDVARAGLRHANLSTTSRYVKRGADELAAFAREHRLGA